MVLELENVEGKKKRPTESDRLLQSGGKRTEASTSLEKRKPADDVFGGGSGEKKAATRGETRGTRMRGEKKIKVRRNPIIGDSLDKREKRSRTD